MHPAAEFEAKRVYGEPLLVDEYQLFNDLFHLRSTDVW